MRFHFGAIPEPESRPAGEWKPMREPGPILMQAIALPLGFAACALFSYLWWHFTTVLQRPVANLWLMIGGMIALIPVHELLHALVHPKFGLSRQSVIGAWPARMLCYAHYDGVISRNRHIAILATPFLVITVAPLLISALCGRASVSVAFLSSLNAIAAGGDLFAIAFLFFQVPSGAKLWNQGWRTYWDGPATKKALGLADKATVCLAAPLILLSAAAAAVNLSGAGSVWCDSSWCGVELYRGGFRSWTVEWSDGEVYNRDGTFRRHMWHRPRFHHVDWRELWGTTDLPNSR